MEPIFAIILASTLVIGPAIATALGFYAGRRASFDAMSDLRDSFEQHKLVTSNLRTQIAEYFDRATSAQARARSERQRAEDTRVKVKGGDAGIKTRDQYLEHLGKGGAAIPEVEAALGL